MRSSGKPAAALIEHHHHHLHPLVNQRTRSLNVTVVSLSLEKETSRIIRISGAETQSLQEVHLKILPEKGFLLLQANKASFLDSLFFSYPKYELNMIPRYLYTDKKDNLTLKI